MVIFDGQDAIGIVEIKRCLLASQPHFRFFHLTTMSLLTCERKSELNFVCVCAKTVCRVHMTSVSTAYSKFKHFRIFMLSDCMISISQNTEIALIQTKYSIQPYLKSTYLPELNCFVSHCMDLACGYFQQQRWVSDDFYKLLLRSQ